MSDLSITADGASGVVSLKLLWRRYIQHVAAWLTRARLPGHGAARARRSYPCARPAYLNDACMRREMRRL
ncbi:hypothetical protein [Mycolicibacterium fluoranthenivorans]|uniref:Uncharacterized protein n=1 Tax=Mycolicibacterium fluoranthenivorans TaxID=258505 RepID=A0A7X5U2S6_9MYCO|nr:hypothetical protein [Mycolicibacterium fluoranthenivorans]MCV7354082.1 hypothetical protein [Mycolicibacterium fluoranthenivorans]NIH97357.1 hypothetical protein [Mycolicibacterium fluoranthenivorans]